jgi:L-threonylcarbamoyladenylate synthase
MSTRRLSDDVTTQIIIATHPQVFEIALELLRQGQALAFPTDTVYGVGVLAHSYDGIEALYRIKQREATKAIPILIGQPADLERVAAVLSPAARRLAQRFWPGALTLVIPRHTELPANLGPEPTVGVRMPAHPFALELLRQAGPMAVTSANLSGGANASTAEEVLAQLGNRLPLVIDGGRTPGGLPSTVVDCSGETMRILRQGPISEAEIRAGLI